MTARTCPVIANLTKLSKLLHIPQLGATFGLAARAARTTLAPRIVDGYAMDRTEEGAPKPLATSSPAPAPPLRVTPDNVVELAILFQNATGALRSEITPLRRALRLSGPWMNDPASKWMREFFHNYFLELDTSFLNVVQAIHNQHKAHAEALEAAAREYGKLDELNAARAARIR